MNFAAAIASGLAAANAAFGVSFALDGGGVYIGVIDRRADATKPRDGGLVPDWDATLNVAVAQFAGITLQDEAGENLLDEAGLPLTDDDGLKIGRKLTVLGQQMRIVALDFDGHQYTARLTSIHQ
jgi:hypothetical protein